MCQANLWNLTKKCIIIGSIATDPMKAINLEQFTVSESDHLHSAVAASTPLSPGGGREGCQYICCIPAPVTTTASLAILAICDQESRGWSPYPSSWAVEQHRDRLAYGRNHTVYLRKLVRTTNTFLWRKVYSVPRTSLSILFGCHWGYIGLLFFYSIGFLCWIVCRSCNEWSSSRRAGGRSRAKIWWDRGRVASVHCTLALCSAWQWVAMYTGHWQRHFLQNNINKGYPFGEGSSVTKSWEKQHQFSFQCPDEDRVRVMMMGWCRRPPL